MDGVPPNARIPTAAQNEHAAVAHFFLYRCTYVGFVVPWLGKPAIFRQQISFVRQRVRVVVALYIGRKGVICFIPGI